MIDQLSLARISLGEKGKDYSIGFYWKMHTNNTFSFYIAWNNSVKRWQIISVKASDIMHPLVEEMEITSTLALIAKYGLTLRKKEYSSERISQIPPEELEEERKKNGVFCPIMEDSMSIFAV